MVKYIIFDIVYAWYFIHMLPSKFNHVPMIINIEQKLIILFCMMKAILSSHNEKCRVKTIFYLQNEN